MKSGVRRKRVLPQRPPLLPRCWASRLPTSAEIQRFYQHLDQVMVESGFLDPNNPRLLTRRVRRLFNRVEMTSNEVNILRGILSAVTQSEAKTKS